MRYTSSLVAYFRNFVFGVEDSLVSTVGLLSGIAIAGMDRETLFVTGVVLIFVEAISMSAGSFLSESSAEEMETQKETTSKRTYLSALVMFVSYFISGFIPLLPYVLIAGPEAFWVSIAVSIAALFTLGVVGGQLSRVHVIRNGIRMAVVGGLAIGVGVLVGSWVSQFSNSSPLVG